MLAKCDKLEPPQTDTAVIDNLFQKVTKKSPTYLQKEEEGCGVEEVGVVEEDVDTNVRGEKRKLQNERCQEEALLCRP